MDRFLARLADWLETDAPNEIGQMAVTRKLELVSDADQHWLMSTWPALAIPAGLKRLAIVIAKTGLSKMAIEEMLREGANPVPGGTGDDNAAFQSRTFDSVADALRWVAAPPPVRR